MPLARAAPGGRQNGLPVSRVIGKAKPVGLWAPPALCRAQPARTNALRTPASNRVSDTARRSLGQAAPIHPHIVMAHSKRRAEEQNLEVLIFAIILDRNSQVCFHNPMETTGLIQVNRAQPHARSALYNNGSV